MKKVIFTAACILFFNTIKSQSLQWVTNAGSATTNAASNKVIIDAGANVLTVGLFTGTADFSPGPSTATLTALAASGNGFVQKLNSTGTLVWVKGFIGTGMCTVNDVVTDVANNVYVTGNFNGSVDFDPGPGTVNLTTSAITDNDLFIAKLTSAGGLVWVKQIGASFYDDMGNAISIDASGNVFVGGNINSGSPLTSTLDLNPGSAVTTFTANGQDGFVLKLDNNGNYLTAQTYGGNNNDFVEDIETDLSGNVYIVGSFQESITALFPSIPGDQVGAYTAKLTSNLVKIWSTRTNQSGASPTARGKSIEVDASGNIYYSGVFHNTLPSGIVDFDPSSSTATLTTVAALYQFDCGFVCKLSSTGVLIWVKNIIEPSNSSANGDVFLYDMSLDGSNNVICVGTFIGAVDFDPTVGTYYKVSAGVRDYYISKLDQNGLFFDVQTYGGTGEDRAYGIKASGTTAYYVAGLFTGTVDFSSSVTTSTLVATGASDAFVAKYAPCIEPAKAVAITPSVITICAQTNTVLSVTPVSGVTFNWYNAAGGGALLGSGNSYTTTAITTTTYLWAEATNTCGAAERLRFAINTLAAPVASISASSNTLCSGSTITLAASGAITYTWSTAATTTVIAVSPTITTVYTVTGTGANSCKDSQTFTATIANPTVNISASSPTICSGATTSLTASGASTYSWNTGATTNLIAVSPTITTVYTATGTTASGCKDTHTISISVNLCTGLSELSTDNPRILVYPNPNNGNFTIVVPEAGNYTIVNSMGQIVREIKIEEEIEISINNLAEGIYYFSGKNHRQKIVITK